LRRFERAEKVYPKKGERFCFGTVHSRGSEKEILP
jgi:hypothetical protein